MPWRNFVHPGDPFGSTLEGILPGMVDENKTYIDLKYILEVNICLIFIDHAWQDAFQRAADRIAWMNEVTPGHLASSQTCIKSWEEAKCPGVTSFKMPSSVLPIGSPG